MQNETALPPLYLQQRDHLVQLAMTQGLRHFSRQRAMELEEESETHGHGLWLGMRAAVKVELQRLGFRPHPDELKPL